MPMTQTAASTLLDNYNKDLDLVQNGLTGLDAVSNSTPFKFIPELLEALKAIANPKTTLEAFDKAQKHLESSVKIEFNRKVRPKDTMFDKFEDTYKTKLFKNLQDDIREGLKAELVVESPAVESPVVLEPATISPAPVVDSESQDDVSVTSETINIHAPKWLSESVDTQDDNAPQAEQFVEGLDLSFWLKVGLSVALVASIALSIAAVMTANPVLLGVGIVATAASGVALARTLGFFNSNPVTPEVPETEEQIQDNTAPAPTE
tara:strand:- start:98690 stop:99478 length:789 start_codon:yes stop_codon:yes gene_type:complete